MTKQTRRRFTPEYKEQAVARLSEVGGGSVAKFGGLRVETDLGWAWSGSNRVRTPAIISVKGTHFPRDVILSAVHLYVRYPVSYRNFQEIMRDRGVHIDHATLNRWVVKLAPQITVRAQAAKRQGARSWRMNAFLWLRGIALRIAILQAKCLNNIIAQDHRSIKRITRPVKGFKAFASAAATLAGIKVAHMVRKGQFEDACGTAYERFAALAGWVRPKIQSQ